MRAEWRWLLMGPGLGLVSGFVATFVLVAVPLLFVAPLASLLVAAPVALLLGAPIGAGVGLVAGLPFVFLVGPHLALDVARRRAGILGAAMPPLVMFLAGAWWPGGSWGDVPSWPPWTWLGAFPYLAAAVLGGITAEVAVRVDMPRSPSS